MRYNKIRKMDISNGPGVRVSIFMQGCTFNCKNCFNPETHDFKGGREFGDDTIDRVLELCDKDYIVGLSILGGEPMHPINIDGTTKLAKAFKEKYPDKNIWVWTGFLFDKDLKDKCGDCSIRALTKYFGITWLEAFDGLVKYARQTQQMINATSLANT